VESVYEYVAPKDSFEVVVPYSDVAVGCAGEESDGVASRWAGCMSIR